MCTCWKRIGGDFVANKLPSRWRCKQVDSSSPCDCFIAMIVFVRLRAEATTSLAYAGIQYTLALWWSANDVEVSCKAVRVFLLVRKLREVWMRATQMMVSSGRLPTDVALLWTTLLCCSVSLEQQRHELLEIIRGTMTEEICLCTCWKRRGGDFRAYKLPSRWRCKQVDS